MKCSVQSWWMIEGDGFAIREFDSVADGGREFLSEIGECDRSSHWVRLALYGDDWSYLGAIDWDGSATGGHYSICDGRLQDAIFDAVQSRVRVRPVSVNAVVELLPGLVFPLPDSAAIEVWHELGQQTAPVTGLAVYLLMTRSDCHGFYNETVRDLLMAGF